METAVITKPRSIIQLESRCKDIREYLLILREEQLVNPSPSLWMEINGCAEELEQTKRQLEKEKAYFKETGCEWIPFTREML